MKILFLTNLCENLNGFRNISELSAFDCSGHGLDYPLSLLKELSKTAQVDVYSPPIEKYVHTMPNVAVPDFIAFLPQTVAIPHITDLEELMKNKDYDILLVYAESIFTYVKNFDKVKAKKALWFLSSPQQILLPKYDNIQADLALKVVDNAGMTDFSDRFRRLGLKTKWLPLSVDGNRFRNLHIPKKYDYCLLGNMNPTVYPLRVKMLRYLLDYKKNAMVTPVYGKDYVEAINQSKMFLTCSGICKFPVMKYYEAMACGSLLVADEPMDAEELGFRAGENYAAVEDIVDLGEETDWYTTHVAEADEVARRGEELVRQRHTNEVRAKELYEMLKCV